MANPLLALQVQPPSIDVAGSLGRGQELKTITLANALNEYRMKQMQRQEQSANALQQLYGEIGPGLAAGEEGAVNRLAQVDPTAAQGFKKEALGLDKAKADIGKVNTDTLKSELDIAFKRSEFVSNGAQALLQTPAAARPLVYERLKQFADEQGGGIKLPDTLPNFDDATLKAIAGQAISAKDQIAAAQKAAADAESARHNRASENLTARDQNMTDARARDANSGKAAPAGYRYKPDGNLEVIPGGPADTTGMRGKATDAQRVTALFADRAKEANRLLSTEGREDASASPKNRALGSVPLVGNFLVDEKYQEADQAKRDFINAVLRKESGAVIGADEFDNADKQYFPQPGDSASVKQQKRRNRDLAVKGLERAAGSALDAPSGSTVIDFNDLPDN